LISVVFMWIYLCLVTRDKLAEYGCNGVTFIFSA
jgi:hypothetical protein